MDSVKRPRVRVAVALMKDDKMLLVEHTKAGRSYWLLPGGGLEWGEGIKEAARREVLEETGFDCQVGQLVLVSETVAPDSSRHLVHLVYAAKFLGGHRRVPDNEERITDVAWIPYQAIPDMVLHPPMQEAFAKRDSAHFAFREQDDIFLGNLWVD